MKTVKLLLGILELSFLPGLIIIRLVFGFQAGIIHWAIGGAFFYLGLQNIKQYRAYNKISAENSKTTTALNVSSETKQSEVYKFLLNSYENWRNGYFDSFSDYYKKAATKDNPELLVVNMLNEISFKNFLDNCFSKRLPESNEIMYTISPEEFMITNKTLYINVDTNQDNILAIPLCEIIEYKNKGVWMKSGIIKLKNGKEIHFKLGAVPDEKSLKQLQEILGCEQLMSI